MLPFSDLLLPLAAGFLIGLFFFLCLWFTVQRLPRSRHPILVMIGSGLLRFGVAFTLLYLVADGRWQRLPAALAGFVAARTLLVLRWHPPAGPTDWIGED